MTVRVKLRGAVAKARMAREVGKALAAGAEHLLGASQQKVPLEEGTLSRSGAVTVDAGAGEAAVSYDTVYAVRQHEELTWRHDPGRQAKYLEEPAVTEAPTVQAIMAARLRRATGGR